MANEYLGICAVSGRIIWSTDSYITGADGKLYLPEFYDASLDVKPVVEPAPAPTLAQRFLGLFK
jgi:hypothetical protein